MIARTLKIGVTGGIGSGKSTVCRMFAMLGVPVYDSDARARELMERDPGLRGSIIRVFGEEAYQGGELDRPFLAGKVFGDKDALARLNGLVHPAVIRDFRQWALSRDGSMADPRTADVFSAAPGSTVYTQAGGSAGPDPENGAAARNDNCGASGHDGLEHAGKDMAGIMHSGNAGYVIVESAILFESGLAAVVDCVVNVAAPVELRIRRTMERDGVPREKVAARIANQMDDEELGSLSDLTILNDDAHPVWEQVLGLDARFRAAAGKPGVLVRKDKTAYSQM